MNRQPLIAVSDLDIHSLELRIKIHHLLSSSCAAFNFAASKKVPMSYTKGMNRMSHTYRVYKSKKWTFILAFFPSFTWT